MKPTLIRVLRVLASGGCIEARRTYPDNYHFWLTRADGTQAAPDDQLTIPGTEAA